MNTTFSGCAVALQNEYLLKTEALFVANRTTWLADFGKHFQETCLVLQNLQDRAVIPTIAYLEYVMLYTNFINRRYVAEVFVYNNKSYIDKTQRQIYEFDISFLFTHFDELWTKLLAERNRYANRVTAKEIRAFMLEALPDFYSYLANIARFAIANCVDTSPFTDIAKNDVFRVNVGDYMAITENVYTEKKKKDTIALADWFQRRLIDEYTFDDYSGLDFSGYSFPLTDFRYSQFRNSCLNNTSFDGCALIGTNFHKANLDNCCLKNSSINEADFSNATLKNASFLNAYGRAGLPNSEKWLQAGYLPVNFRNADLTNVNFTGANLSCADFTGAELDGTDFTDAILNGAVF
jgi:uncharacterized protein YjbI with pentapeptide repeats